jgi:hypothetical protein
LLYIFFFKINWLQEKYHIINIGECLFDNKTIVYLKEKINKNQFILLDSTTCGCVPLAFS